MPPCHDQQMPVPNESRKGPKGFSPATSGNARTYSTVCSALRPHTST